MKMHTEEEDISFEAFGHERWDVPQIEQYAGMSKRILQEQSVNQKKKPLFKKKEGFNH